MEQLHADPNPASLHEAWELTRTHLHEDRAQHLDSLLHDLGDQAVNGPMPSEPADKFAYHAWKGATPESRRQLAQLWIRAVGHGEFEQE